MRGEKVACGGEGVATIHAGFVPDVPRHGTSPLGNEGVWPKKPSRMYASVEITWVAITCGFCCIEKHGDQIPATKLALIKKNHTRDCLCYISHSHITS
jgi:hypothetical protein